MSRRFGSARALSGIDLEIPTAQTVVVSAPHAQGKTTLIKLIDRNATPTSGESCRRAGPPRERRGRLGFLAHTLPVPPPIRGGENSSSFAGLRSRTPGGGHRARGGGNGPNKRKPYVHTLYRGRGKRGGPWRGRSARPGPAARRRAILRLDEASGRRHEAFAQGTGRGRW